MKKTLKTNTSYQHKESKTSPVTSYHYKETKTSPITFTVEGNLSKGF